MAILVTTINGTHTNVSNQASASFETSRNGVNPAKVKITLKTHEGHTESKEFPLTPSKPIIDIPRINLSDNIFIEGRLEFKARSKAILFDGAFSFLGQFTITAEPHIPLIVAVL